MMTIPLNFELSVQSNEQTIQSYESQFNSTKGNIMKNNEKKVAVNIGTHSIMGSSHLRNTLSK